jgi:hypothetical protein
VRTDASFLADAKLSAEDVVELCLDAGADAVISFDRLLFKMRRDVNATNQGYYDGQVRIDVSGILRSYVPGEPTASKVMVADSIFLTNWNYSPELTNQTLPASDEALRLAARYIGSKYYSVFVPHWETTTRQYYTSIGTLWKMGAAQAERGNWDAARESWITIYNGGRWSDRAKAAANIALAFEINGNFAEALRKAEESYNLFLKHKGSEDPDTVLQQEYCQALKQRLANEQKLSEQL